MSPCTLFLALQMLLNSPMLDAAPVVEPAIADGTPLQIGPVSSDDIYSMLRKANRAHERVLAFSNVRVGFDAQQKWLPLLGQCEVGKSSDLVLLLTKSPSGVSVNAVRLEKYRHRITN